MSQYPEHEKMNAHRDAALCEKQFVQWLRKQGFVLCKPRFDGYGKLSNYESSRTGLDALLMQYHNIDMKKIHAEKQQMFPEAQE